MRDEIQDQFGNAIYLTDERWEHIVEEHSELDGHRAEVLNTVRSGKRSQDPLIPNKFFYNKKLRQLIEDFDEIEVVVIFRWQDDKPNNFIVTAYSV